MPGIDDVARLAGVSTATVSRALSGNGPVSERTRARVADAAAALGYVVSSDASSLASGRTRNIGVVVPRLNRWFFTAVIEGAERELLRRGYDLTLYNLSGDGEERRRVFDHHLLRNRVDAVIAVALALDEDEVSRLLSLGKPIAGVGGPLPGASAITIDDVAVARVATEHLLSLGHRRIAHVGGSEEYDLEFHTPGNRRLGYESALRDAGITPDPSLFRGSDFTIPGGHAAAIELLAGADERPTAVFAASDEMAIGCILAARELGLTVPGDLSVIGVDDHPLAAFFGLSTIAQYPERQGEEAVELLVQSIEDVRRRSGPRGSATAGRRTDAGTATPVTVPVSTDLVVRASTSAPDPALQALSADSPNER
ncbi:LacI family DNA-binding transcriptional regulator [Leifsonia sp. ZF2019]|uniref:LacI family DNA-binding transcriptional regulator n=1 Tax=Leifsonia sp. ZF2019 TaxID=2781978 RepID=UPI001CC131D4|nr:LacI family DNA-binding transcriptional regulator [Leifsonia sp. ZF2019]UAJ80136.1 LacI family DNA-binding transcriptional regulator [Leifsonia sp. ZF2019]